MRDFAEIRKMADALICEHQWDKEGNLVVFVNNYNFEDFMNILKEHRFLFEDDGILSYLQEDYVIIPFFNEILEMMGFESEEIKGMFNINSTSYERLE